MMVNRQKHGTGTEFRAWSDLPVDILNVIAERLDVIDRIYFRVVCKNWRLTQIVPSHNNLPWLMEHSWAFDENVFSLCSFHFPYVNRSHVTYNKFDREELDGLYDAVICASKYGWLLLQKSTLSVFYNPYTKSIIRLPDLDISFNRSTFSSVPTSPDCVCFAIQSTKNNCKILLSICRPGDRKWSTLVLVGPKKAVEDVVYSNGTFFCVFTGGTLGAFCVADHGWSLVTNIVPGVMFESRAHMVESNGQLWLVRPSQCFKVFKFDWSAKTWVKTNTLGCQALFLGCTSFSVSAEGETSGFAERIYYHCVDYCYYYLVETKQNYRCATFYPWVTKRGTERVWIQPPEK